MGKVLIGNLGEFYAPAGYGLGKERTDTITDASAVDNLRKNGWYEYGNDSTPLVSNADMSTYGAIRVDSGGGITRQTLNTKSEPSYILTRTAVDSGTWSEWEWENPPMVIGTHYRTTERFNGKPVYVVLFNLGKVRNLTYGVSPPGFDWTDDDAVYKTVIQAQAWFGWNDGSYIQPYIHPTNLDDDGFIADSGAETSINFDKKNYDSLYSQFADNYFFVNIKYVI